MMVYAGVSARQTGKALEVFNLVFGKLILSPCILFFPIDLTDQMPAGPE